ncbi:MAG: ComEC/Rec2 family competence protein [Pelolinea sp.]|nr:ComEC/Rec2 family competence protein [Pelolinea sp.]
MPLFWFCLTALIGIFIAPFCDLPLIFWGLGSLVFLLIGILEFRYYKNKKHVFISHSIFRIPIAFLLLGFFLGVLRYQSALPYPTADNILGYVINEPTTLMGTIKYDPIRTNDFTSAVIKSESITVGNKKLAVKGDVSLLIPAGFDIRYGDRLELIGNLSKTYENDSLITRSSLAQKKVFTRLAFPDIEVVSYGNGNRIMDFIYRLRERAHSIIFNIIPFPESAVLSGILLGIESEIPEYLWDSYQASGTIHIIAISGFNITIIALLSFRVFRRLFGWKWALPSTISVLLFYTLLVGADPPVIRAAIMGILALTAHQIGRRPVGIYTLVLAAIVMLIGNPFLLWSISFQLSFLATLALLTIVDPMDRWVKTRFENHFSLQTVQNLMPVVSILTTTFSATLVIFPILFKMNPQFSTISMVANFLIAPFQPAIMIVGGLAAFLGFIIPPNINVLGIMVWPLIAFCDQIAIRLSISSAAVFPLPDYAFWISLVFSVVVLIYFSYRNIFSLSNPNNDLM